MFRKFAFIGFKSETEAQAAVQQFNKTFIDTAKIEVLQCTYEYQFKKGYTATLTAKMSGCCYTLRAIYLLLCEPDGKVVLTST